MPFLIPVIRGCTEDDDHEVDKLILASQMKDRVNNKDNFNRRLGKQQLNENDIKEAVYTEKDKDNIQFIKNQIEENVKYKLKKFIYF